MTNRFFRNAVGVAALTSLALGLACSGSSDPDPVAPPATVNKPGTPIVNISGLTASNNAITKHQYLISASDPSGLATSFSATGNNGGTLNAVSGASGMWMYIPQKEGNEIITVKATNSSGTSDGGGVMASVVANQQIQSVSGATVPAGQTKIFSLPDKDSDGDALVWTVTDKGGLDVASVVDNHKLTITTAADAKDEYTLKLKATEKYPNANGYTVDTKDYTYIVTISAGGGSNTDDWGPWGDEFGTWAQGNAQGHIQAYPNNLDKAAYGVPFTFQFNAGVPNMQSNEVIWWGVNGGITPGKPEGNNAPPPEAWISQPMDKDDGYYRRPSIGALGNEFERWRMGMDFQNGQSNNRIENFPAGRLYFVPQDTDDYSYFPDTYSARTLMGVRADFAQGDRITAWQNFYINVTDNTPLSVNRTYDNWSGTITSTANLFSAAGRITTYVLNKRAGIDPRADENVPLTVPWVGKGGTAAKDGAGNVIGVSYGSEPRLVFRHANDNYSYDLSASIDLSRIEIVDPDISKFGDVITFMLDGVTYGDHRLAASGGSESVNFQQRSSNQASKLQGSVYDVTAKIRPYLARPYPVKGKDLANNLDNDAIRAFNNNGKSVETTIYVDGVDDDHFEDGVKKSVYQAHSADGKTYISIDAGDYNARGNLRGRAARTDDAPIGLMVAPSPLQFVTVPKLSDLGLSVDDFDGSQGLTFHYTVVDLGGNRAYFEFFVPTRDNFAPQLDAFNWNLNEDGIIPTSSSDEVASVASVTHGDLVGQRAWATPRPEVWASAQPSEGTTTTWRFQWWDPNVGTNPQQRYIADRVAPGQTAMYSNTSKTDPVYLMVPPGKQVDNYSGMNNPVGTAGFFKPDTMHDASTAFELSWKPTENQGRKNYSFDIYGWDKYGAGMRPLPMKGSVWGSLKGTPIYKTLYSNGEPFPAGPANLTIKGNARVSVNPFFNTTFPIDNKIYNQYGFDNSESWLSSPTVGSNDLWVVPKIPPGAPLLVSAARTSSSQAEAIQFPVIGPPVVSQNWNEVGSRFASIEHGIALTMDEAATVGSLSWETGNLISYAYIEPEKAEEPIALTDPAKRVLVDLTAHVGSGQLARQLDRSLDMQTAGTKFYVTGIELPKPWGIENSNHNATGAGTGTGYFDYWGYMYGIGSYGMIKDGVIQVAMPSVGQSAFFYVKDPDVNHEFPSTAYANRVGWFNQPLTAKSYISQSSVGDSFEPIVLPIFPETASNTTSKLYAMYVDWTEHRLKPDSLTNGGAAATDLAQSAPAYATGLPYTFQIGEDGTPNYALVSLKRSTPTASFYATNSATSTSAAPSVPVWQVERTGKPTWANDGSVLDFDNDLHTDFDPDDDDYDNPDNYADKNAMYLGHHSNWGDLDDGIFGNFVANINRDSFGGGVTTSNRLWSITSRLPGASTGAGTDATLNITTPATTRDYDAQWRGQVKETLQVLSYVNGTELGPDNHQALPVLLEFGDINSSLTAAGLNATYAFRGRVNYGTYPIYKPTMWPYDVDNGKSVPVASYIARYEDKGTANFFGTMGVITDNISQSTFGFPSGFAPISNLKITASSTWLPDATNPVTYERGNSYKSTRTGRDVSNYLTGYTTITTTSDTAPGASAIAASSLYPMPLAASGANNSVTVTKTAEPSGTSTTRTWAYNIAPNIVYAKAYNDQGNGGTDPASPAQHYKVWLTWTNPSASSTGTNANKPNISGNIIEFFNSADFSGAADTAAADSVLPLYKVYVGPDVNAFPIPDAWLPFLGYSNGGNTFANINGAPDTVVIRVRTVRYGDKTKDPGTPGAFVNFNVSPFKQALPAAWIDTLTTKISFADVGTNVVNPESESTIWGAWRNGLQLTDGFWDGTAPDNFAPSTYSAMPIADKTGPANTTVGHDLTANSPAITAANDNAITWAWSIGNTGTTSGQGTAAITRDKQGADPAVTVMKIFAPGSTTGVTALNSKVNIPVSITAGATGTKASTVAAPTVTLAGAALTALFNNDVANLGKDDGTGKAGYQCTITIPMTLTLTYKGKLNSSTNPRTATITKDITFVITGPTT